MARVPIRCSPVSGSRRLGHQSAAGRIFIDATNQPAAPRMAPCPRPARRRRRAGDRPEMNTHGHSRSRSADGYLLIEMLVYISILLMLLAFGYTALYRCINNSVALRHNADDI